MRHYERRDFLKHAGMGLAVTGLGLPRIFAQANREMVNVRTLGATGDGKTLDTPAINKAIETIAGSGGGTLFFPAGNYLCYSIRLKSNIAFYLDEGATIIAADSPMPGATTPAASEAYDAAEPNEFTAYQDYGHSHWHNSLMWGEGIENFAITGPGRIWGKGLSKGTGPGFRAEQPGVGNKSIALKNCHNVLLRDISMLHGGHFAILATGVDNLTIDNLKIDTNRDGMDIDCCRNVRISNCYVNSPWDDGICLKSSYGLGSAKQTEFVTISNCYVSGCFEEGTLLDATYKRFAAGVNVPHTGRIKFGTEANGGYRNVTISNCEFEGCQGLALETVDGALLEDVTVTNLSMRDIISAPIFMRLGRRMRGPKDIPIGTLKRIVISNVVCSNSVARLGSIISGIPDHNIEDVRISGVVVQHQGGGTKENAALQPMEREETYPEPGMFGTMPSHGFYIRHVKGIQLSDIEIRTAQDDQRPAFYLDQVEGADFYRIRTPRVAGVPEFVLNKVSDFSVHDCNGVADAHVDQTEHQAIG